MRRTNHVPLLPSLAVAAFAFAALPAALAARQQACPAGGEPFAHFGLTALDCPGGCAVAGSGDAATAEFRAEPRVVGMDPYFTREHGIRDGDVIVAVGGHLITTREGGRRWATMRAGESVTFRIRRGDRELELPVTPVRACGPVEAPATAARYRAAASAAAVGGTTVRAYPSLEPLAPATAPVRGSNTAMSRAAGTRVDSGVVVSLSAAAAAMRAEAAAVQRSATASSAAGRPARTLTSGTLVPTPASAVASPGWLGFALECDDCGVAMTGDGPSWHFGQPPALRQVESGSPAARAGMRRADRIVTIDGVDITTPAGGLAFTRIEPGQTVRIGYTRDGARRLANLTAESRPALQADVLFQLGRAVASQNQAANVARGTLLATPAAALNAPAAAPVTAAAGDPAAQPLRYSGAVANARIEVRSAGGVMVTETVPGEELEILVNGALVRVRIVR